MSELTLHTTRQLTRPPSVRWAMGFSLLAAGLTLWLGRQPRYFGIAVIVAAYVALWNGFAFVSLARFHALRQGSSLVPRLRDRTTIVALGLAATASLLPLLAAAVVGQAGATMVTVVLVALALGWAAGPLLPAAMKFGVLALAVGAILGLNVALYGERISGGSETDAWSWPGFVDPVVQQVGLSILALGLIAFGVRQMSGTREDSFVMRRWWTQSRDSGDETACGGGIHPLLLELLPSFARRKLPVRDNGRTQESQLQRDLLRYSLMPLSPAGTAVLFLPLVLLMAWIGVRDGDKPTLFANPNLFLLNGVVMLVGGMKAARIRRELMRPLSRPALLDRIIAAMAKDGLIFAACLLAGTVLVHLLCFQDAMRSMIYWTHYLMSPGLALLAFGVSLYVSRFEPRAYLVGFFVAWVVSLFAALRLEEEGGSGEIPLWIGASVVAGLVGWGLVRAARRSWIRAELE